MPEQLVDSFGRIHDYLRISVTDSCNLRCVYCMGEEETNFLPRHLVMSNEEIIHIVQTLAKKGISRIRLTGGEPLLRSDVESLIAKLAAVPKIREISMTTNGVLLAKKAERLRAAGLTRVNISLDTLQPKRYSMITRGGDIQRVLDSIKECLRVGLDPVKVNVVLMDGVNHDEIADFLKLSFEQPLHIRFIEYMPIGPNLEVWRSRYLPLDRVIKTCHSMGWKVNHVEAENSSGPANYYQIEGGKGRFGFIHPVSKHFCNQCNRLRLTADGHLKGCLYWNDEYNIRKCIGNEEEIINLVQSVLNRKPKTHEMAKAKDLVENVSITTRKMSQIGG